MKRFIFMVVIAIGLTTNICAKSGSASVASATGFESIFTTDNTIYGDYYTFYGSTMCKAVQDTSPFDPIDETTYFGASDSLAMAWVHLTYLYEPVRVKCVWVMPDSQVYLELTGDWSSDPQDSGYDYWYWWKFWGWISINEWILADSSKWGIWKVDIFVEENYSGEWNHDTTMHFEIADESVAVHEQYFVDFKEPISFSLLNNYPNPFNPVTTISYQLPKSAYVNLSIYNIFGQLVVTLINEHNNAGYYLVEWNASAVGSGVYFYRIEAGEYTETKKCLILK